MRKPKPPSDFALGTLFLDFSGSPKPAPKALRQTIVTALGQYMEESRIGRVAKTPHALFENSSPLLDPKHAYTQRALGPRTLRASLRFTDEESRLLVRWTHNPIKPAVTSQPRIPRKSL